MSKRAEEVTYARVLGIALPVVLSNATAPIQGAIDTAIIGNLGSEVYLAAVALGAGVMAQLLALFNFLQFGAGALSAQALGAGDRRRVINVLARALIIAAGISVLLIALQVPLAWGAMLIFEGSAEAEALATTYITIRLWAAPAELSVFAILGWFSGQEVTRRLFEVQVITSVLNIAFNLIFVLGFGMDVDGVALGTVLAAWLGLGWGIYRVRQRIAVLMPDWWPERHRLLNRDELLLLMRLNRDIFIRTFLLIAAFTWMIRLGSVQGDVMLAANGILHQLFLISTYGLDGFAIATESLVGQAVGARDRAFLRRSVRVTTMAAAVLAVGFCALLLALEGPALRFFTNVEDVRSVAANYYVWAAMMPLIGIWAFQLDGVFVGAAQGPALRNAMIVSAGVYLALSGIALDLFGNDGVWAAIWGFLMLRALTLGALYPSLERRTGI